MPPLRESLEHRPVKPIGVLESSAVSASPRFLEATEVVDFDEPSVRALASELASSRSTPTEIARACFEWVESRILHTSDHALDPVTCSASEVLRYGTGYCYAKSHLLVALLRAAGIPAGFSYQRLATDTGHCLHGLAAVCLPDLGWYRVDPRGARPDLRAAFDPPGRCCPFAPNAPGELDFRGVWAAPEPRVVRALRAHRTRHELEARFPDALELTPPDVELPGPERSGAARQPP